ncbi:M15 family metallopeptidase [Mycobacterium shottsii]|uniref:M15 family metallopeptidase n=1 Tax=Mycobacterium shottsii TaxID=133549 RepID=UPI003898E782
MRRVGAAAALVACGVACGITAAPSGVWTSPDGSSIPSPPVVTSVVRAVATTASVPAGSVPPVSAAAAAAGLVDVRSVVPDAIIDLRYATTNNFTRTQLYPANARCLVHESMAPGLTAAAAALRPQGQALVFWDCYRPHDVQVKMFQVVPNPAWLARPGQYARSHEAGRSVDVTYASVSPQCPSQRQISGICLADMGTDFDDFSAWAKAFATEGVSEADQAGRKRLRDAMNYGGLSVYSGEWWHFDGSGAGVDRPILNAPVD